MAESFQDSASYEKDRSDEGLIEVAYADGSYMVMDIASVRHDSYMDKNIRVHYEELVLIDGLVLKPYTYYGKSDMALKQFGDELRFNRGFDGKVSFESQRQNNLNFLSVIQALAHTEKIREEIAEEQDSFEDAEIYPELLSDLKAEGRELWIRFEPIQLDGKLDGPIMARLEYIEVVDDGNSIKLIPHLMDAENNEVGLIPEGLTYGYPWLYVAANETAEPDAE